MNEHLIRLGRSAALLLGLACAATAWAGPTQGYWHEDASRILPADAPHPASYRSLNLDFAMVAEYLKSAHERGIATEITLPQPDGGYAEFMVTDSGTMPEALQRKYPDIISLKGQDSQGRPLRLDVSPLGFQAMVFDPAGVWVVRPEVIGGDNGRYLSFNRAEQPVPDGMGACEVHGSSVDPAGLNLVPDAAPMTQTGVTHRLYRAAVAANNRYITAVGGGTVAGGLAATVVAVNRVTQVYEYEMSIQLRLVENNDLLMFPNAASDPFASNGTGVINNSTTVINGIIGSDAYDIGHVFTTGSGGVAGLGVVCGGSKARGTTGLPNPTGDSFYIDFVAHEMGHQFRANHPFNGSLGNCAGGNRNGSTAYEPGSGSTIMAYAGICSSDDLQPHSDPFFHAISLQEINNFTSGSGSCSVNTENANQAPVIDTASLPPAGLTIPMQTPFALKASATDADGEDSVTYSWEEWDLGPQAPLTAGDNGSSPIFRPFPPVYTGERLFPKLSTILTGTAVKGEILPTTTRTLKFRLTARDMRPGWGTTQSADISLNVVNTAGPFLVTAPAAAASWAQGSTQSVTWNVANTNVAPVSCSTVDIALSADGGQTFPYVLASGVANSGSASITTPSIATGKARVRVRCASNLFFDISHGDFTIPAATNTYPVGGTLSGLLGQPVTLHLSTGQDLVAAANGAFAFPIPLANGTAYAVTVGANPTAPAQTCNVTNGSGSVAGAPVSNVIVSCASAPLANYTVGGTVSGLDAGNSLTLRMNGSVDVTVSANGAFTFPASLADGSVYTVLVATQPASGTCHLGNNSGTVVHANVTDIHVTCPGGTTTYTVGGSLSGLHGSGLKLQLNGGDDLLPTADGSFTFATPLADGSPYEVTVATQPTAPAQTCTVTNGSGTVSGADVTDVEVACEDDIDDVIFKDGFDDGVPEVGYFENFDGYTAGSDVAGQGGWIGWGNDPSAGATVVNDPSSSAPNSVRIEGASDLVHPFSGYTSGSWTITAKQFVPNDFNGASAFIFLNTYVDGDGSWSTQVSFDSATGMVSNDAGATASNSLPLVKGQWVELKLVVDLDNDLQTFFYNGSQLYSGTWKSQYDDVGVANLGALDLFANDASAVYYDDIRIAPTKP